MKRIAPIAVSVLGCALLTSACGSDATAGDPVVLRDAANHTTVHVAAGRKVELLLSSGYWYVEGSSARSVLTQDGGSHVLARPTDCPDIPGLGCTPEETLFTALAPGTAVITASRRSCGEARRCPGDQASFSVTVVVG